MPIALCGQRKAGAFWRRLRHLGNARCCRRSVGPALTEELPQGDRGEGRGSGAQRAPVAGGPPFRPRWGPWIGAPPRLPLDAGRLPLLDAQTARYARAQLGIDLGQLVVYLALLDEALD